MLKADNFDEPIIDHDLYCVVKMRIGRHVWNCVKDPDGSIVKHFLLRNGPEAENLRKMLNEAYNQGHRDGRNERRKELEELQRKYDEISK